MTKFDLTKMPFDSHVLHLDVSSSTFDKDYVQLKVEDQTVFLSQDFYMVEFDMVDIGQKFVEIEDP